MGFSASHPSSRGAARRGGWEFEVLHTSILDFGRERAARRRAPSRAPHHRASTRGSLPRVDEPTVALDERLIVRPGLGRTALLPRLQLDQRIDLGGIDPAHERHLRRSSLQYVTCRSEMTVSGEQVVLQNPRMIHRINRALLLLIIGAHPLHGGVAHAGLGADAAGVLTDAALLHGAVTAASARQFDIEEISADSGIRVREYLNQNGVVFAVSWSGPVMPDLQPLLGAHYVEYRAGLAALSHPGLHRSVRVASSELIVESGGHLRAYAGRAYLPAFDSGRRDRDGFALIPGVLSNPMRSIIKIGTGTRGGASRWLASAAAARRLRPAIRRCRL